VNKSINNIQTACSPSPIGDDECKASNSPLAAHQAMCDALVLDARLRQSLLSVRSLGRKGLRVTALGTAPGEPTFASRWCQNAFVFPTEEGTEAYMTYLEQLLDQIGARVLIASSWSSGSALPWPKNPPWASPSTKSRRWKLPSNWD
jgi:hypothetical protein